MVLIHIYLLNKVEDFCIFLKYLRTIKRTEGISTTDIVGRLLTMSKEHHLNNHPIRKLSDDNPDGLTASEIAK